MTLLEQLQQLAPLAAQATAAPWALCSPSFPEAINTADDKQHIALANLGPGIPHMANAAFIAAARNLLTPENLTLLVASLAPQWVPVSERMPTSGEYVALIHEEDEENEHLPRCAYYDATRWRAGSTTWNMKSFSHWMPLPSPPTTPAR